MFANRAINQFPNDMLSAMGCYKDYLLSAALHASDKLDVDRIFEITWRNYHKDKNALELIGDLLRGMRYTPDPRAVKYRAVMTLLLVSGAGALVQHFLGPTVIVVSVFIWWAAGWSYNRTHAPRTITLMVLSFFVSVGAGVAWLAPNVAKMLGSL
jgi:hypothetical protein